jgi:16S rRNA (guanine1207-N2)-methyltransferase
MPVGYDVLSDALNYALEKSGGVTPPVAVVNATGAEDSSYVRISDDACNKLPNTLDGVFNTVLVRATRQLAETLGLVALAHAHCAPDGRIYVAQENAHGAGGVEKQLTRAFPNLGNVVKFKCRVLVLDAADAQADILLKWVNDAAVRKVKHNRGEFWSAPGVFSWDRPDAGSVLLLSYLPKTMAGNIADLGCGNGLLTGALSKKEGAAEIWAMDADSKAVECCKLNLADRGATIPTHVFWRDATGDHDDLPPMDFVVMNPPFHTQQAEDRELGQKFCEAALKMLKTGGELYLVANRHMPYEDILEKAASRVILLADTDGFKIIRAVK